jgi:hypothetical protein
MHKNPPTLLTLSRQNPTHSFRVGVIITNNLPMFRLIILFLLCNFFIHVQGWWDGSSLACNHRFCLNDFQFFGSSCAHNHLTVFPITHWPNARAEIQTMNHHKITIAKFSLETCFLNKNFLESSSHMECFRSLKDLITLTQVQLSLEKHRSIPQETRPPFQWLPIRLK